MQDTRMFSSRYGPWAVVTGASSGIGRQLAILVAARGLDLLLVGRDRVRLEETATAVRGHGREARIVVADLAQPDALAALAQATKNASVGLLILAAGFGRGGPFLDSDDEVQRSMVEVNCTSVMALTHYFAPGMVQRGRGGVLLIASLLGFHGIPYAAHYAATKAYVQSFGEALGVELSGTGVDVLVSSPGPTATRFGETAGMRLGKAMQAQDVARDTLEALGRSRTVLPGALTKLLLGAMLALPRSARVRMMGRVMKGMT